MSSRGGRQRGVRGGRVNSSRKRERPLDVDEESDSRERKRMRIERTPNGTRKPPGRSSSTHSRQPPVGTRGLQRLTQALNSPTSQNLGPPGPLRPLSNGNGTELEVLIGLGTEANPFEVQNSNDQSNPFLHTASISIPSNSSESSDGDDDEEEEEDEEDNEICIEHFAGPCLCQHSLLFIDPQFLRQLNHLVHHFQDIPRPSQYRDLLPVFPYKKPADDRPVPEEDGLGPRCTICLGDYEDGVDLKALPCLHKYHAVCIDHWLRSHNSCPICKHEVDNTDMGLKFDGSEDSAGDNDSDDSCDDNDEDQFDSSDYCDLVDRVGIRGLFASLF